MKQKAIFLLWFIILSIPLSYMMGSHSLSLLPSKKDNLKSLVKTQGASRSWSKLHFLGGDCGCSENVFKHLMGRKPLTEAHEQIFVIGVNEKWISELTKQGYDVTAGDMDDFSKKYSINAVPQLTILDENKKIIYSGGYTSKRGPASVVEDQKIYQELKEKHQAVERPIFGCLNGTINRKNADPLKMKY